MTTTDRLAEIRARAEAATEGPWEEVRRFGFAGVKGILCPNHVQVAELVAVRSDGDGVYRPRHLPIVEFVGTDADAEFIAHARTDLPTLLAAVVDVMKRHKPGRTFHGHGFSTPLCTCGVPFPCPTIQAITAALEVQG